MSNQQSISEEELALALEKAYRRGFQQALTLLATCYPSGVNNRELVRLANMHLQWRRELPASVIADNAALTYADSISPLELQCMGR